MRLVLFGPGRPFRSGIASTTTALAMALQGRGHELLFLGPKRQYPSFLYPGTRDEDPELCPEVPGSQLLYAPFEVWTWMRAADRAREFGADAWIFPYWTWAWAPFLRFLLWRSGSIPVVGIVHNRADHGGGLLKRWAARLVLEKCDGFLTHAKVLAEGLGVDFPGRRVGFHLLPPPQKPPVQPSRERERKKLGIQDGERLALFLGLIRPYKGVDLLIEAFRRLGPSSPWRLLIAGEAWGDLGGELEEAVPKNGLSDIVGLRLRWQSKEEVEGLLVAADLLILPYRSGSQSAVAPLGLSRGVPILATAVGGLGELISDGINGRLVQPGSVSALAKALAELEEEDLDALGRMASASVESLDWDSYAGSLEELLIEVLLA